MGLLVMILGLVLFLGVHTLTTQRDLRARLIASRGRGRLQDRLCAGRRLLGLALIVWGFAHYRATGMWRALVSAEGAETHHRGADAAGGHPGGGGLYPRPHLHRAEASDAGRASSCGRRRICSPMAISARIILFGSFLGWAVFDRISLKRRADAGAPPIPVGGVGNDLIAVAVGVVAYLALGFRVSSRRDRRSRRSEFEMSVQSTIKRKTAPDIRARKNGEPIVMLTSYHAHTAALVDRYCDVILVGDSLGNVMHGFETTVPVTLDMMILQGHAVMRGSQQRWSWWTCRSAPMRPRKSRRFIPRCRILKETHCGAVKLEGGARMAETDRVSVRARRSRDGPYRPDAAVDQHARLVSRPGPRGGQLGADRERRHARLRRPARSRW